MVRARRAGRRPAPIGRRPRPRIPGCLRTLTAGTHTIRGGPRAPRTYRLALPPADGARHPLLVVVHGFASSATQFDRETNFERAGTKRGYVVVSPDALGSPTNWNLFGTKGQPDDYAFVGALAGSVMRGACVDPGRVFIAGHSAGSAFSGFLACRKPYRFAAVAMVSATVPSTCPRDVTPAVISVHGTADPAVPYAGGLGIGQTVPIPPVRTTIAQLAKDRALRGETDRYARGAERRPPVLPRLRRRRRRRTVHDRTWRPSLVGRHHDSDSRLLRRASAPVTCVRRVDYRGAMQLSDIDLLDRDRFTQGVPHEWFTYLRQQRAGVQARRARRPGLLGDHEVRRRRCGRPRRRDVLLRPEARRRGRARRDAGSRRLRRGRPPHAHDGRARAHALPQAREPRLHAAPDAHARTAHSRAHRARSSTR